METQLDVKRKRINLGTGDISMSEKTARKLNYIMGGLLIISSIYYLISFIMEGAEAWGKVFSGGAFFLSGSLFLFRAHFELSPTSKYAPHFIISQDGLKIKKDVFKKSEFINWTDVKKIELGYYKIGIKDRTGLQYFPYKTRKETSVEIKRAIEDIATQKGIEVENLLKR